MTDRELLELAAKAIGGKYIDMAFGCIDLGKPICSRWNPITDDGDALRLAVKLRFNVDLDYNDDMVRVFCGRHFGKYFPEPIGDDANKATRRAIVRAAAEIGKGMP